MTKPQIGFCLTLAAIDRGIEEGNERDSKAFDRIIARFFDAFKNRKATNGSITIEFDKDNNSKDNLDQLVPR
ncbi:MAG: hypothetical protein HQM14_20655 [SAR324 cluster bacterium]|nr:hypothetical protein [SAR324 cluster bacterium]